MIVDNCTVSNVDNLIKEVDSLAKSLLPNIQLEKKEDTDKLRDMFYQCFMNTAETTVEYIDNKEVFVITGDINAMWLRDSSCQVVHYLSHANQYTEIRNFIRALINKQFEYIRIDAYANAFMKDLTCKSKYQDLTDSTAWSWERKYEIDSLCYPIWLLYQYYSVTKDKSIFTAEIQQTMYRIISLWRTEQNHDTESEYSFERMNCRASDTLPNKGKGTETSYTGMTWSGFRPSDDACEYGYLIPANMFAVVALQYVEEFAGDIYEDEALKTEAEKLRKEIQAGIESHGIYHHETYGDIYAYETDGRGNYNLMDDANVPSLLSLPWLGYCDSTDPVYQNTRQFILSKENPYYYEGTHAKGIGSPHTPDRYIWPIALMVQGLTSVNKEEQMNVLNYLMHTDADTGYMHEGVFCDDPKQFTRSWFAWANSLFSLYVTKLFCK